MKYSFHLSWPTNSTHNQGNVHATLINHTEIAFQTNSTETSLDHRLSKPPLVLIYLAANNLHVSCTQHARRTLTIPNLQFRFPCIPELSWFPHHGPASGRDDNSCHDNSGHQSINLTSLPQGLSSHSQEKDVAPVHEGIQHKSHRNWNTWASDVPIPIQAYAQTMVVLIGFPSVY